MSKHIILLAFAWSAAAATSAAGRPWTDSTGNYQVEADLMGFSDAMVILQKENHALVGVPVAKLSKEDREYLRSKEAEEAAHRSADQLQTWTLRTGVKVIGKVVAYGRKEVALQRRRGKIYVNDRLFDNLPEVYQRMVPKIVAHFENAKIDDQKDLESWIVRQKGTPRSFTCEGVILELENGDEYGVPFFFFSDDDLKVLQPGWQRWLAAQKDEAKQHEHDFMLQSQAAAYQRDRQTNQQIAVLQLEMAGYQAGLFDLWEVGLMPKPGVASPPLAVVVPGRDSRSATQEAMRRYPDFVPGAVSRVRRKN